MPSPLSNFRGHACCFVQVQLRFEAFHMDDALDEFQLCTRQPSFEDGFYNCERFNMAKPPPRVLDYWTPLRMRFTSRRMPSNTTLRAAGSNSSAYKVHPLHSHGTLLPPPVNCERFPSPCCIP
jgi:hypothetical protein